MTDLACPRIEIRLSSVIHNTRVTVDLCARHGIDVAAVTKVCCGMPAVAAAMLGGGARWLADSRCSNLRRLRSEGRFVTEMLLLRSPSPHEAEDAVSVADISLVSELLVAGALGRAADAAGRTHKVVLMVDMGDLREGVMPERAVSVARSMDRLRGIELCGVGTNLACFAGLVPTPENTSAFLEVAREVEAALGRNLPIISGGNSSSLPLCIDGTMPRGVTQLRVGESILLGCDVTTRKPLPGYVQDGFVVVASIVEVQDKPSVPPGPVGQDAFGHVPRFKDRGIRRKAIAALGRQDTVPEGLAPLDSGIEVLGASSDHLILDVTDAENRVEPGSFVSFKPSYGALLACMTSPYVHKYVV